MSTAGMLRERLLAVPEDVSLVVDLCDTYFMDSTGLHLLLGEHERRGHRLHVARTPDGSVSRLFSSALSGPTLRVYDCRDAALAAAAGEHRARGVDAT